MEYLNAEAIKNELEGLANYRTCPEYIKDALALINSQEQRIGELAEENERLKKILSSVAGFDTSLLCAWCREEQTKKIAKEMLEGEK